MSKESITAVQSGNLPPFSENVKTGDKLVDCEAKEDIKIGYLLVSEECLLVNITESLLKSSKIIGI